MVTADRSSNECLLPHSTVHFAFALSVLIMLVSSIFIYFFAAEFGTEITNRWMLSLIICLLVSIIFLEPLKILFFSLIMAIRRVKKDPSELDNLVERPMVEKYDQNFSSRSCNVNPPQGFALEKARENVRKLKRWNHLKFRCAGNNNRFSKYFNIALKITRNY